MSMTAADVLSQLASQNSNIARSALDIQDELAKQKEAGNDLVGNLTAAGQDTQTIDTTKEAAQAAGQAKALETARTLGVAPDSNNSAADILSGAAANLSQLYQVRDAAQARVIANPPSFVRKVINGVLEFNRIDPSTADERLVRETDNRIKSTESYIQDTNQLASGAAKTQQDIAPTKTAATVAAVSDLAVRTATDLADKARIQTAQYNIEGIKTLNGMSQEQVNNSVKGVELQLTFQTKALQQEALKEAIAARQERLNNKLTADQELADQANDVRVGLGTLNGQIRPNITDKEVMQGMLQKGPIGDQFRQAANIGFQKRIGQAPVIDSDPGAAAMTLYNSRAQLGPDQKVVTDLLNTALGQAANGTSVTGKKSPTFNPKDVREVQSLASSNAQELVSRQAAAINPNDLSNIYTAPTPKSILAIPAIQSDPFAQKVVAPLAKNGMVNTDPKLLIDTALGAVKNGTLSFNEAIDGITNYFTTAAAINNVTKQYSMVGLPKQKNYNAVLPSTFGHTTVDLTDKAKVTAYFSKQAAKERFYQGVKPMPEGPIAP